MKLYNTLTRQKEAFSPLADKKVGLYCCGPTVYNYAHIGNLRTYVSEDLLRRTLEFNGYEVNHVMNITDVGHLTSDSDAGDDKMKKGAEREQKTVWEIADFYAKAFLDDMAKLNLKSPHITPKATDHIEVMISQIKALEDNGHTYIGHNGNVYFDTSTMANYGELAQLEKQELQSGARIEVDPNKKNPADFVLWFVESKHGEQDMQWDSPWGRGFPGWHIECSAMSIHYLGEQFDIHCGGIDHVPVHHTNELAQAEGATGVRPWVKTWMHGEFLVLRNNEKMSKSADNFLTLNWLIEKGFDPLDYRYFCLQTHYRKQLFFDWSSLEASRTARRRLKENVLKLKKELQATSSKLPAPNEAWTKEFRQAVNDDLNLPQALAIAWEMLDDGNLDKADKLSTIVEFDRVLGLKLSEEESVELPDEIKKWIAERNEARQNKDWAKADEIRDQIEATGEWQVKDGEGGTEVVKK